MDDIGVHLATKDSVVRPAASATRLVAAMPKLLTVISVVGTAAMLWVGGHILLVSLDELSESLSGTLGRRAPRAVRPGCTTSRSEVHDALGLGRRVAGWLVNTLLSALVGLVVGAVVVARHARAAVRSRQGHDEGHGTGHATPARRAVEDSENR